MLCSTPSALVHESSRWPLSSASGHPTKLVQPSLWPHFSYPTLMGMATTNLQELESLGYSNHICSPLCGSLYRSKWLLLQGCYWNTGLAFKSTLWCPGSSRCLQQLHRLPAYIHAVLHQTDEECSKLCPAMLFSRGIWQAGLQHVCQEAPTNGYNSQCQLPFQRRHLPSRQSNSPPGYWIPGQP